MSASTPPSLPVTLQNGKNSIIKNEQVEIMANYAGSQSLVLTVSIMDHSKDAEKDALITTMKGEFDRLRGLKTQLGDKPVFDVKSLQETVVTDAPKRIFFTQSISVKNPEDVKIQYEQSLTTIRASAEKVTVDPQKAVAAPAPSLVQPDDSDDEPRPAPAWLKYTASALVGVLGGTTTVGALMKSRLNNAYNSLRNANAQVEAANQTISDKNKEIAQLVNNKNEAVKVAVTAEQEAFAKSVPGLVVEVVKEAGKKAVKDGDATPDSTGAVNVLTKDAVETSYFAAKVIERRKALPTAKIPGQ